jgi:hypothetical protein
MDERERDGRLTTYALLQLPRNALLQPSQES